ncbi:hypothetical protein [Thiorhodovibrio frisius]|uniref:Uncharacterized protein n=1 Tax=Thiorhodovibrio frisius TaxID=631362 RepID=H8Z2S4_9GAMM|nr:hypothetical protein [Thiorhodovibrio frisius]EIC21660.1 hypothetical protein Thi970DRAFT_01880 [Thiorhodovibrio frisius]WPL21629.1 hypothetical protein Thiofri_01755 [Thiorhodovibrio frisius]
MKAQNNISDVPSKDLDVIKYSIKKKVSQQLPYLPDIIEEMLFMQGRIAWNYYWTLLDLSTDGSARPKMKIEVTVKLKKEFHQFCSDVQHVFSCSVQVTEDFYHPRVIVKKKSSPKK